MALALPPPNVLTYKLAVVPYGLHGTGLKTPWV